MVCESGSVDYWRKFFRSADSNIFEVIDNAIVVAASDCPTEFTNRRDRIAEKLFTVRLSRCFCCDGVVKEDDGRRQREEVEKIVDESNKLGICNNEGGVDVLGLNSNYSYDEAEALTEEIEEESQTVGEVLRIKAILVNNLEESDAVLFESLRRLQLMALSVDTLKATEIGRAVNRLRKHNSKQIRYLVRTLIDGWKVLVDEWVNTANAINIPVADNSPDSVNPSVLDEEEGLPSPPLDEGAFFATQTTSIQLSEFFDGMDDDGNFRTERDFDKKPENRRRQPENHKADKEQMNRQEPIRQTKPKLQEAPIDHLRSQDIIKKQNRFATADSGPGRPKLSSAPKASGQVHAALQKKPATAPQDKLKNAEDASVRAKLEVAKRKLQERYQEAENAKKQRTIQVMELRDIPKQAHHNHRQPSGSVKPKNHSRNWGNLRR